MIARIISKCQQESEHLYGFAQSHVIGKARAEAEFRQDAQPSNAGFLIWPQRGAQTNTCQVAIRLGMAQSF